MRRSGVFISLTGEYQNVGDGLIRRVALDWVRSPIGVTAYVGNAPQSWIDQMKFVPEDRVVRGGLLSFLHWVLLMAGSRATPTLVTEPGEMTLARYNFPRQFGIFLAALVARLRRGHVVLPPRAVTRRAEAMPWKPTVTVHRWICRMSSMCMWRDGWSIEQVGIGNLCPDTAFAADLWQASPELERKNLVVSVRGQRAEPTEEWVRGIISFARQHNLEIVTLAQVDEDMTRARQLATRLSGWFLELGKDGYEREVELRDFYLTCAIAVSDRLHVLILAAMSGCIPTEVVESPTTKVRTHFKTIGYEDLSLQSKGMVGDDIAAWLTSQLERRHEMRARVREANARMRRGVKALSGLGTS